MASAPGNAPLQLSCILPVEAHELIAILAWTTVYYIGLSIDSGLCNNIGIGAALGIVAVAGRSSSLRRTLEHFVVSLPSLFCLLAILLRLNL